MHPILERHLDEIRALCREYGVRRLCVFGSATTDAFREETSDFDFVVDFADRSRGYADRYLAFAEALEVLLGRPVDLLTERAIKSPYFRQSVEATRQKVYDERDNVAVA